VGEKLILPSLRNRTAHVRGTRALAGDKGSIRLRGCCRAVLGICERGQLMCVTVELTLEKGKGGGGAKMRRED